MKDFLLSYDTVCLRPKHSNLESRELANTSLVFCGYPIKLPVIPANMLDVIGIKNAKWLSENGYFYIYHRFGTNHDETLDENLDTVYFVKKTNKENWKLISISTGTNDKSYKELITIKALRLRVDFITIDVAHSDHENIKPIILYIKENFPNTKLIVGNVATAEGAKFLVDVKVDSIKVGIGGGRICTTAQKTGFHLPTLHSVMEISNMLTNINSKIPIIADGGSKYYGDIAKALTFGATMVMSGGWFASCLDSPAKIVDGKKIYRGSTSYEVKGERRHIEGRMLELEEGLTYQQRMEEIKQALSSAISYAGGKDLSCFKSVEWERILPYH
jgi:GMP reductase